MTWTTTYEQDTDEPGVGTVTAMSGTNGATHSERVDTNTGKGIDDFVARCRAVEQKITKRRGDADAVVSKIAVVLNG